MALASTAAPDRPQLTLSSNNPFRNRATSPSPQTLHAPAQPRARPLSTNPFLDDGDLSIRPSTSNGQAKTGSVVADIPADIFVPSLSNVSQSQYPSTLRASAYHDISRSSAPSFQLLYPLTQIAMERFQHFCQLFANFPALQSDLSLLDKPASQRQPPPYRSAPPRPNPEDRRDRPRAPPRGPSSPSRRDIRPQHQRRASESSVMERERRPRVDRERPRERDRDRTDRPERTESEERRRRERRKEREERHRKEKEKGRKEQRPTRKPQGLDIIDKLDVTGIYGQGLFHHDGPFDACNPHRNAKKDRRAPMQAFPEGSMNMALGGSGPVRKQLDIDAFHGRGVEGFTEYAAARKKEATIVDPTRRFEPVHGEETFGLGTSTFLEGAPASKSALQRRESDEAPPLEGGGLSRKKSLAQRIRGMSGSRRYPNEVRSPSSQYGSDDLDNSPPAKIKAVSAGGLSRARYNKENEINPFENDYEAAFDKKGAQIRIAEQDRPSGSRTREPGSPKRNALVRSVTTDGTSGSSNDDEKPGSSGFLNRMKSLKTGPRKPRVS